MLYINGVELQVASTKTQVCIYANVVSEAEEVREESEVTNKINLDPPASPKQSKKSLSITPTPKPIHVTNRDS